MPQARELIPKSRETLSPNAAVAFGQPNVRLNSIAYEHKVELMTEIEIDYRNMVNGQNFWTQLGLQIRNLEQSK